MWWLGLIVCLALGGAAGWWLARRQPIAVVPPAVETAVDSPRSPSDAESRLLRIVEALPLGVLVFDERGRQMFANGTARGLTDDHLQAALLMPAVADVVEEARSGQTAAATRMLELFGNGRIHVSIRGVPVEASVVGEAAVVVTVEDVTELRRADLLRRDFVANVSHELKTPIGAIGVLAETLLDVEDPAVAQRLAGRLNAESFRLASTVDDLLTLARIESGEQFHLAPVAVVDVMAAVVERVGTQADARGITVEVSVEPADLTVMGDRMQLVSGFGNLVDNAVKYSGDGSRVSITAEVVDGRASISVTDRGIGIPEADLDRIFERFYRVDRGRSRDTGGTGLGLSIVRHVLLNHDGEIDVRSIEGEGTTFHVTLPLAADQSTGADANARNRVDVG